MIAALPLPATLPTKTEGVLLRRAVVEDLSTLMSLLSDDPISASRVDRAVDTDEPALRAALIEVIDDPANDLLVVIAASGEAVGTMQLTRIPGMARRGSARLLIEAVRVRSTQRSNGIGSAMMRWVTDSAAPAVGASLVQLTSDKARTDAHRFYERLGFVGSHLGFKLAVPVS
ncbi:GNAT family N-acetyltransferase [Streptomyces sp. NP160]|uniref:GNAT family N-acetyltransferase n=1 Tax=Streptomyces sp. NP160 TaxID=2586637 RepID=UPI00111AE53A|nr:GNAT family N-acetyltransferase [Streptomyces sp. NP160]TNM63161.1 GNAT family N-acetyltransferase [Streptomyces sp. NP160]